MYIISIFIVIAAFGFSLSSATDVGNQRLPTKCKSDFDCSFYEACYRRRCIDVCLLNNGIAVDKKCGNNSMCYSSSEHTAYCACYSGYFESPGVGCIRDPKGLESCLNAEDCLHHQKCQEQKCVDICQYHNGFTVRNMCGENAYCFQTVKHTANCRCYSSYQGDPYSRCEKSHNRGLPCESDADCSVDDVCYKDECINACYGRNGSLVNYNKCGRNAHCIVSQPHVGVCICHANYNGNPYSQCNKIVGIGESCDNDDDCQYYTKCFENECVDICKLHDGKIVDHKCGINAYCYDKEPHVAECKCYDGHSGDPFSECYQDL